MSVLSPALLGAVALVLLASGLSHLLRPAELRTGLAAHDVLPPSTRAPVRAALPVAELGLGLALLGGVSGLLAAPAVTVVAAAGAAVLLGAFTGYLWLVLRRHPGAEVPCACGLGSTPVTGTALARAALLAGYAVTGALTAQGWLPAGRPGEEVLVAVAAAVTLAVATGLLPAARVVPSDPHLAGMTGGAR